MCVPSKLYWYSLNMCWYIRLLFCSYNILILLVTYVLPIILIGICSFHMGVVLWMRQPVGVITPQLQRARRKKQKVSRISCNVLGRIKESKLNSDKCDAKGAINWETDSILALFQTCCWIELQLSQLKDFIFLRSSRCLLF